VANFRLYYFSEALRMKVGVNVIIPENTWGHSLADRPEGYRYPVLWLQSGGGFDYTDWQSRASSGSSPARRNFFSRRRAESL